MGHSQPQSEIRVNEEQPHRCNNVARRGALACIVNTEVGAVLAVMRQMPDGQAIICLEMIN